MNDRRKLPSELREGLAPIRIGLLRDDYQEAFTLAIAERDAHLTRKLEILRELYGVSAGPGCWRELCLAMARERFPGFRVKSGRKPPKWTMAVHWMLAGEMRREIDAGGGSQEKAAQRLASREPWQGFLQRGRWKGRARPRDRKAWENLFSEYTHMPESYRAIGEGAYRWHVQKDTIDQWDRFVSDLLEYPTTEEK